ncbi:unnamed protein product [Allacma fusca]|uniref:ATP synthase subunit f, mitochondrial n=1 Tax=Allacma fusca TaxID=39272 RepID=A0A8J2Q767_9HEXA|nr:unnamed protein product [Allacma fusca]
MAWGEYPVEYNPKVHGPYDPARYYGKPDTKLSQVKLGELGSWLARRNKNPIAMVQAVSRAWWRWNHKFIFPRNAGLSGPIQVAVGSMLFFYVINYRRYKNHRFAKYH